MPSILRTYRNTLFKAEHIQEAVALVEALQQEWDETNPNILKTNRKMNSLSRRNETWNFDSFEEFFAEYRKGFDDSHITNITSDFRLSARAVFYEEKESQTIEISAPSRPLLERIAEIFERNAESSRIPEPEVKRFTPIIFIGHGRSPQWRDLKDHLHEQHKYEVQAYEIGARAGHTIRDILDDMLTKSSFAILVMTAELDVVFLFCHNKPYCHYYTSQGNSEQPRVQGNRGLLPYAAPQLNTLRQPRFPGLIHLFHQRQKLVGLRVVSEQFRGGDFEKSAVQP